MNPPVLQYEGPRKRPRIWNSYDAIVVGVLVLGPIVILIAIGTWRMPPLQWGVQPPRQSPMVTRIQAMRAQVALFKLQHNGRLPGAMPLVSGGGPAAANPATFWAQMTQYTDVNGNTSAVKTATHVYGPYVLAALTNPLNNSQTVAPNAAPGVGFVYDYAGGAGTGKVWGVDQNGTLIPQ
jgi:hypothetical protein